MKETSSHPPVADSEIFAIERPDSSLWTYYVLSTLITGPLMPFILLPFYFRYHSMRYRFSDEGVSMNWGVLFRKEINLTYARIQDIHLTSNFVERWLGLARIQIQTASGSAKAEMTIEGVREYGALRDFLYTRMRGARGIGPAGPAPASASLQAGSTAAGGAADAVSVSSAGSVSATGDDGTARELTATLREVTAELRAIREALGARGPGDAGPGGESSHG